MEQIKCPKCGEVFHVDETGYAQIVKQVRDKEFKQELERLEKDMSQKKQSELEVIEKDKAIELQNALTEKDNQLKDKELLIEQLRSEINNGQTQTELAVSEERQKLLEDANSKLTEKDSEIQRLQSQIEAFEQEKKLAIAETEKQKNEELNEKTAVITDKDSEILRLQSQIKAFEQEKKLAIAETEKEKDKELSEKKAEIIKLEGELKQSKSEIELTEKTLKEKYDEQLKMKDEEIERYRDFKAKQSTKMIGESLEQHCQTKFNQLRMTAFPNAYFEKDNDASSGSKGDFIFRECSSDGNEFISIMFEMKNEADATEKKHRNEDFFKELDKDRREKNCEYAVLVSMLESDSDYYNDGIVDVSYKYEKMYVIRPQFFIPIITLLRNAALNSVKYRDELATVRNQQVDLRNFEDNINEFKQKFAKNYETASKKFNEAIDSIDKSIKQLEKVKEALTSSERQMRLANDKADDLTVKRLTKNAPSVRRELDEIREQKAKESEE